MKNWPQPKFEYGDRVKIVPMENAEARVVDLHFLGLNSSVEYDVVYYLDAKQTKVRVFEDELVKSPP